MGAAGSTRADDEEALPQLKTARSSGRTPRKTPDGPGKAGQRSSPAVVKSNSLPPLNNGSKRSSFALPKDESSFNNKQAPARSSLSERPRSSVMTKDQMLEMYIKRRSPEASIIEMPPPPTTAAGAAAPAVPERTKAGRLLTTPRQMTPRTPRSNTPRKSSSTIVTKAELLDVPDAKQQQPRLAPLPKVERQKSAGTVTKDELLAMYLEKQERLAKEQKLKPLEYSKIHPVTQEPVDSYREYPAPQLVESPRRRPRQLPVVQEISAGPSVPSFVNTSLTLSEQSDDDAVPTSSSAEDIAGRPAAAPVVAPKVAPPGPRPPAPEPAVKPLQSSASAPAGSSRFASSRLKTAESKASAAAPSSEPQAYKRGSVSHAVRLLATVSGGKPITIQLPFARGDYSRKALDAPLSPNARWDMTLQSHAPPKSITMPIPVKAPTTLDASSQKRAQLDLQAFILMIQRLNAFRRRVLQPGRPPTPLLGNKRPRPSAEELDAQRSALAAMAQAAAAAAQAQAEADALAFQQNLSNFLSTPDFHMTPEECAAVYSLLTEEEVMLVLRSLQKIVEERFGRENLDLGEDLPANFVIKEGDTIPLADIQQLLLDRLALYRKMHPETAPKPASPDAVVSADADDGQPAADAFAADSGGVETT